MGREIRRVPANWEHPKDEQGHYHPMYDNDFDTALEKWLEGYNQWKLGTHPDQQGEYYNGKDPYWEWEGPPPNPYYYHPKWENSEWYQVYETVSEGTPVTPPFATKEELIDYLVTNGDFWDQSRGHGGWDREAAEFFCKTEWAPSGIFNSATGVYKASRDITGNE